MITICNPEGVPAPKTYHHGIEVSGNVRTLYIAGQIGMLKDGVIPAGIEAQTRAVYVNLKAVLRAADMKIEDIVKTTVFLLNPADFSAFAAIRAEETNGARNASTLVYVAGLALPDLLVEIEAVAVKSA